MDKMEMSKKSLRAKLHLGQFLPNLAGLFLAALGSIVLAWVASLTLYDVTVWRKDITTIFFGSRTGEAISLGIGMKVIHYFLIGLTFITLGLLTILVRAQEPPVKPPPEREEKLFSKCPYHFGYLASRPKNSPIPQECLICTRLGSCMTHSS